MFDLQVFFGIFVSFISMLTIKDLFDMQLEKRDMQTFFIGIILFLFAIEDYIIRKNLYEEVYICSNFLVICFLFTFLFYKGNITEKILNSILTFFIIFILKSIIIIICDFCMIIDITNKWYLPSIVRLFIYFIISSANTLSLYRKEVRGEYWSKLGSILIVVGGMIHIHSIMELGHSSINPMRANNVVYSIVFTCVAVQAIIYFPRIAIREYKNKIKEQEYSLEIEEYRQLYLEKEDALSDLKKFRHDYKNHLISIEKMMDTKSYDRLNSYLTGLMEEYQLEPQKCEVDTGNMGIDALLTRKFNAAKLAGIEVQENIMIPKKLNFSENDICTILGNAMDNAIEATSQIDDKKKRKIWITLRFHKNNLIMCFRNPYSKSLCRNENGKLLTKKVDKENHGLGLQSIEKIADKYDGIVEICTEHQEFNLTILLYGK